MTTEKQPDLDPQMMMCMKKPKTIESDASPFLEEEKDEEMTQSALAAFRAKEEEIERRRSEIRERVQAQLTRVEEEAKRLHLIHGVSFQNFSLEFKFFCSLDRGETKLRG